MSDLGFVGPEHQRLLANLVDRLERVRTGDAEGPRIVVIEGPSGSGKSRVIRELYRALTKVQPEPPYWPNFPEAGDIDQDAGFGADVLAMRKVLGPPIAAFSRAPGARPSMSWWYLNCERMQHGELIDITSQLEPQIKAHVVPVAWACREARGWRGWSRTIQENCRQRVRDAIEEGSTEAADLALEALGVLVPGLSLMKRWALAGVRAGGAHRVERLRMAAGVESGLEFKEHRIQTGVAMADSLAALAHPQVPAVVAVEDLHWMSEDLESFLDRLSSPAADSSITVIGTAWPEGHRNSRYDSWLRRALDTGSVEVVEMPELSRLERLALVLEAAPNTAPMVGERVVDRYTNPLSLKLFLSLERVRRNVRQHNGALVLSEADCNSLPSEIRALYHARWLELPSYVREALSVAAGTSIGPGNVSNQSDFIPDVIAAAASHERLNTPLSKGLAQGLKDAVDPFQWCVEADGVMHFREFTLGDIAASDFADRFFEDDRSAMKRSIATEIEACLARQLETATFLEIDRRNLVASRWLIDLTGQVATNQVTAQAFWLQAQSAATRFRFQEALEILQTSNLAHYLARSGPESWAPRRAVGDWLRRAGDVESSARQTRGVWEEVRRDWQASHLLKLELRFDMATLAAERGDVAAAIKGLEVLLRDCETSLGFGASLSLAVRHQLISCRANSGLRSSALDEQRRLCQQIAVYQGEDSVNALTSRANLLSMLTVAGFTNEALAGYKELMPRLIETIGSDAPNALAARTNFIRALSDSGCAQEAVALNQELLDDATRVLGYGALGTLNIRRLRVDLLVSMGDIHGALQNAHEVVNDMTRVLGENASRTLSARVSEVRLRAESGEWDSAVAEMRVLVETHSSTFGPWAVETLEARRQLIMLLQGGGHIDEALAMFPSFMKDRMWTFGQDAPEIFTAKALHVSLLQDSKDLERARSECELLCEHTDRVLGPESPNSLSARSNRASILCQGGEVQAGILELQSLVPAMIRVLGSADPRTVATRCNLGKWLARSGAREDGIRVTEAAVADCVQVLGPDSRTLIGAQRALAEVSEEGR